MKIDAKMGLTMLSALLIASPSSAKTLHNSFYLSMNEQQSSYNVKTDNDKPSEKDKSYHVFADVDLVPTTEIQYAKPRVVIKSLIPKLVGDNTEDLDENVDEFNTQVSELIKTESSQFKERIKEAANYQKTLPKTAVKNNLNVDFDSSIVNTGETPLVSIRFTFSGYASGMGKPYRYHRVLNFDLDSGDPIELSDLFLENSDYLQIISDYSRAILSKKLRNKSLISNGTEPKLENFQNWNIDPNGLRITFDESTVAPSVYGSQTVVIPYGLLNGVIEPDSPIANCLKHQKRCMSHHLRTGAFIDEAINTRHGRFNPVLHQS